MLTCKSSGLISGNSPEMPQIALVAHQHDDNVVIRMIPQLLQPALHILISQMLCDVIDQKSSNCTPVVSMKETHVNIYTSQKYRPRTIQYWNLKNVHLPLRVEQILKQCWLVIVFTHTQQIIISSCSSPSAHTHKHTGAFESCIYSGLSMCRYIRDLLMVTDQLIDAMFLNFSAKWYHGQYFWQH